MSFFKKVHDPFHNFVSDLKEQISGKDEAKPPQGGNEQQGGQAPPQPGQEYHNQHRFLSFAPERHGNATKWYVDGVCQAANYTTMKEYLR
jgi:phospholipase D1/2